MKTNALRHFFGFLCPPAAGPLVVFQISMSCLAVSPESHFPFKLLRWFHLTTCSRPKEVKLSIAFHPLHRRIKEK